MTETTKTLCFATIAAVALLAAWLGGDRSVGVQAPDQVGQPLFPEFTDPFAARSMTVMTFDESLGIVQEFQVAQKEGQWVIPSHEDYPADAEEHLKEAATLLVDLKVISVESDRKDDHRQYGVIEPARDATESGVTGVGKLVSFRGEKSQRLAELIVGGPVRGREGQRYVRIPGKDRVYVVAIDPSKLSTRFEDWVKADLLDLDPMDIRELELRDYSTEPVMRERGLEVRLRRRFDLAVLWNADDYKWELGRYVDYVQGEPQERGLAENEELHAENLNGMKQALDDLKLVDVVKKPAGLQPTADVDTTIWNDQEALVSLVEHGFFPDRTVDGKLNLLSSDGEVHVRMKDHVAYSLLFGQQVASVSKKGETQINRYVMVSAQVDATELVKPTLELPPAEGAEATEASPAPPESTPTPQPPETQAADPESPNTVEETAAAAADDAAADDAATAADVEAAAEPRPQGESAGESNPGGDTARDLAIKEYERKLADYEKELKAAEARARDLNLRLGEWYYVVSEDVYNQIRLGRAKIIKEKEAAAEEGDDLDAFRALEAEGIEGSEKEGAEQPEE